MPKNIRLTINRVTGKATVEIENHIGWRYFGVVASESEAIRLIEAGWPDNQGIKLWTESPVDYLLEVIR